MRQPTLKFVCLTGCVVSTLLPNMHVNAEVFSYENAHCTSDLSINMITYTHWHTHRCTHPLLLFSYTCFVYSLDMIKLLNVTSRSSVFHQGLNLKPAKLIRKHIKGPYQCLLLHVIILCQHQHKYKRHSFFSKITLSVRYCVYILPEILPFTWKCVTLKRTSASKSFLTLTFDLGRQHLWGTIFPGVITFVSTAPGSPLSLSSATFDQINTNFLFRRVNEATFECPIVSRYPV